MRIISSFLMVLVFVGVLSAADAIPMPKINGFVSAGYTRTNDSPTYDKGQIALQQTKVGLTADIQKDIVANVALQLVPYGTRDFDVTLDVGTITFVNAFRMVDISIGRLDVPFSVYNAEADAPANVFVTRPVGAVDGVDDGLTLHKKIGRVDVTIAALNDTNDATNTNSKAVSGRLSFDLWRFTIGAGALYNGSTKETAVTMGEAKLNSEIGFDDVQAYEISLGLKASKYLKLLAVYNNVALNDMVEVNDRTISTFNVQAIVNFTEKFALAARYGVSDCNAGYTLGSGNYLTNNLLGNNVRTIDRASLVANYAYNKNVAFKTEVGTDRYKARGVEDDDSQYGIASVVVSY